MKMSVVETEVWCTCSSPDALYSVYMCTSAGASLLSSLLSSPPGPSARSGMGASLVGSSPSGPSDEPGMRALCSVEKCVHVMNRMPATKLF